MPYDFQMSDLFQSLQMLTSGVKQYQIGQAIQGANEQVQQLNARAANENERMQGVRQVAQGLTMQLAGMGAPASTIEAVGTSLMPKQPTIQTVEQGYSQALQSGDDTMASKFKSAMEDERIARMKELTAKNTYKIENDAAKADAKQTKEQDSYIWKGSKDFNLYTKDFNKALQQANTAIKIIDNGGKMTGSAISTFMARASGEVGNLTESERDVFRGKQDWIAKMKRWAETAGSSELPEPDKAALKQLAVEFKAASTESMHEKATDIAVQMGGISHFKDMDPGELISRISGKRFTGLRNRDAAAVQTEGVQTPGLPPPSGSPPPPAVQGGNGYFRSKLVPRK